MANDAGILEIERKFLLEHAPDLTNPLLAGAEVCSIKQTYLAVDGPARVRIRRIERDGIVTYRRTAKRKVGVGIRDEVECEITETEYRLLKQLADPARKPVRKVRYTFGYAGKVFELDAVTSPRQLWLLEVELETVEALGEHLEMPPGLPPYKEVTGTLSNAAIAKMR